MAKRLMCIVLSVLMIIAVLPTGVIAEADVGEANEGISLAAEETTYVATITDTGESYESLSDAISAAEEGETVQLLSDITLTSAITIASGADIILDLNGYTLTRSSSANSLAVSGTLTLEDSSEEGTGEITNGSSYGAVRVQSGGTFIMNGGTITDTSSYYGVYIGANGVFIMNGGTVSGCKIGVYVNGTGTSAIATFTMNGGTITGNKNSANSSNVASGVYLNCASFTMNGGSIKDNTTPKANGCGVLVSGNSTFTMNGGTISGNTATKGTGSGVLISTANGTEFTMNGGSITGNSSGTYGGGVWLYSGSSMTMTGGAIYGNTASTAGDDIFMASATCEVTLISAESMTAEGQSFTGYYWYTDASGARFDASSPTSTVDVTNTLTGTAYALKAAKPTEEVIPTLYGRSLSLGAQIGINYYFDFSETANTTASGYYVKFVIDGAEDDDETQFVVKELSGSDYYVATCRVYFYQMAENVSINVYNGSDELVGTYSGGSIRSYYNSISQKSTTSENLNSLLLALLNYGGYGQICVNENTDNLANDGLSTDAVTSVTEIELLPYKYGLMEGSSTAYSVKAYVTISSTESCKITFDITTSKTGYTVSIDGTDQGTGVTSVSSGDILVQNWDSPVTLTIYEGEDAVYTLDFSVLSYAYSVLTDSSSSDNLKNLARAMYNYNIAVEAYYYNS